MGGTLTRPAGIRAVADRAGVSVATVSNTINRPHVVSEETVASVKRAMAEIGFVRNEHARQLKGSPSSTVGMITLSIANPFFADLAEACELAAEEHKLTVVIGSSSQRAEREARYVELFEQQRVRGLLIAPSRGISARLRELHSRGTPIVVFGSDLDGIDFCTLALDGQRGSFLAANHLLEIGRRNLWFAGGPLHQLSDRWRGSQLAVANVPGARITHVDTEDQTQREGFRLGRMIREMPASERPNAICAANDLVALGILDALRPASDISVPRDLAIVGYDDIDQADHAHVPLSSVRQPLSELAHTAMTLLLDEESEGENHVHRQIRLAPTLVIRDSTAE